jgi:hypothetical protein
MIPVTFKHEICLFSVNHISVGPGSRLIYAISLDSTSYFFSKTLRIEDCQQLDGYPSLDAGLFNEIRLIITGIELDYPTHPSPELINLDILNILARIKNQA